MAHYVSSQLECIANGVTWGFPADFIEGNGGSVVGVKTKFHDKISKLHWDFGKGYQKALQKGADAKSEDLKKVCRAAGLVNYSDKRLYEYPVCRVNRFYSGSASGKQFDLENFQKTYLLRTQNYRNEGLTKDDGVIDHVTGQHQITPRGDLGAANPKLFTYKFETPPCSKILVKLHLAAFNSNEFKIGAYLANLSEYTFSTNSLPMNCPTMNVIKHGSQTPSGVKYGIQTFTFEFQPGHSLFEFTLYSTSVLGKETGHLHIEDINFTVLE